MTPRSGRRLPRKTAQREERKTVLVVTEGQTEKEYVEGLKQKLRDIKAEITPIKVVDGKGEPSKVMSAARDRAKRGDFDDVWLLLDVDEHAQLEPTLREATEEGFSAAVSNPCFEVWIVWHFEDVQYECKGADVQRVARKHGVDKSIPRDFPFDRRVEAASRASRQAVDINHVGPNPSSGFPRLLERVGVFAVDLEEQKPGEDRSASAEPAP